MPIGRWFSTVDTLVSAPRATHTYTPIASKVSAMVRPGLINHTYTGRVPVVSGSSAGDDGPLLALVDTTYSLPVGGTTYTPANSAALTTALASANAGDVIVLTAGTTYTGAFTLRNITGTGWVYIISSALASLPAGTRVTPGKVSSMPTLTNNATILNAANAAHNYRVCGVHITPSVYVGTLVNLGPSATLANETHHFIFDRCYMHGHATLGARRAVALNCAHGAVIDSWLSDFKEVGADTQAIWASTSTGPLSLKNNHLEAGGENVMTGGGDPVWAGGDPKDIEIRRNHFFKPLSWVGTSWTEKNILEFKNATRILVEGNVFENSWVASGQAGGLTNFKSVNQDNDWAWSPNAVVRDLVYRYNKGINVQEGFIMSGDATENPGGAQAPRNWSFTHNVIEVANVNSPPGAFLNLSDAWFTVGKQIQAPFVFRHNTMVAKNTVAAAIHFEWAAQHPYMNNFDIRDNIFTAGVLTSRDGGNNSSGVDYNCTNTLFRYNAFVGAAFAASGTSNTISNNFNMANVAAMNFTNFAAGNYTIASGALKNGASDGTDVGADVALVNSYIAGVATYYP